MFKNTYLLSNNNILTKSKVKEQNKCVGLKEISRNKTTVNKNNYQEL